MATGGMAIGTGSGENAESNQESATIGARLLDLARQAIKALFKNKWLQKFKLFKKERLAEEVTQSETQKVLERKIDRGVRNSTFGIKMTILKTQRNRTTRKLDEKIEIQKELNRLRNVLREKFINFQGLDIRSDYKTVVVARQEVKNIFGKVKSSRDVIIGFHTHFNIANISKSASQSSIDELKNGQLKTNWKLYEIEVESEQNLQDLLNEKCPGFYFDPNLVQRENLIKQQWQDSIEGQVEKLQRNGLQKSHIVLTHPRQGHEIKQNRGLRI